jgi:NADH-quinone oxidoreductase subunit J
MDVAVFAVSAVIVLAGALGVVLMGNPVHSALSLVLTLFGVAVLFIAQDAHFLAAVQVIVYAGAIVVLFLFVIMLLGVDEAEELRTDSLAGQRPAAAAVGVAVFGLLIAAVLLVTDVVTTGTPGLGGRLSDDDPNVVQLGRALFTDNVFAFELTSVLLVIAVVGAVALARRGSSLTASDRRDARRSADERTAPR